MVSYKNIETGDSMLLNIVLILVVMEDGLVPNERDGSYLMVSTVLILIVVEDGLVRYLCWWK